MGRFSYYSEPTDSWSFGLGGSEDKGLTPSEFEVELAIQMDQDEIEASRVLIPPQPETQTGRVQYPPQPDTQTSRVQYPPQPEVEFGVPSECYCGGEPQVAIRNGLGRKYYTCRNVDDGECHVWKWWDVALMEEMSAMGSQVRQLAEKVDHIASVSDYESEIELLRLNYYETKMKLAELEMRVGESSKTGIGHGFEFMVMIFVVVVLAMIVMLK